MIVKLLAMFFFYRVSISHNLKIDHQKVLQVLIIELLAFHIHVTSLHLMGSCSEEHFMRE